jgi:hypothetical protein
MLLINGKFSIETVRFWSCYVSLFADQEGIIFKRFLLDVAHERATKDVDHLITLYVECKVLYF